MDVNEQEKLSSLDQHAHLPSVGTFCMQGYKVKEKTAIVHPLYPQFQNSVGTLLDMLDTNRSKGTALLLLLYISNVQSQ